MTKHGEYSVKSGYKCAILARCWSRESSSDQKFGWWQRLWKLKILCKVSRRICKVCHNYIPTMAILRRGHGCWSTCPICIKREEIVTHVLFECHRTRVIWSPLFSKNIWSDDVVAKSSKWTQLERDLWSNKEVTHNGLLNFCWVLKENDLKIYIFLYYFSWL